MAYARSLLCRRVLAEAAHVARGGRPAGWDSGLLHGLGHVEKANFDMSKESFQEHERSSGGHCITESKQSIYEKGVNIRDLKAGIAFAKDFVEIVCCGDGSR